MTNTLTFLATVTITSLLATNKTIEYPKRWVPEPCPDKMPGCLVYHARAVDDTEAGVRYIVTTITDTEKARIIAPGYTNTFLGPAKEISKTRFTETLQTNWIRSAAQIEPEKLSVLPFFQASFSNVILWSTNSTHSTIYWKTN